MKITILKITILVLLLIAIIFFVFQTSEKKETDILVLCGGSMRSALETIIKQYKKVSGEDEIFTTYGGSGELLSQILKTRKGDIFICHDPFMEWSEKHSLIDTWAAVGYLDVVIVVPKGNPKKIKTLKDLTRPGIRLGIGDQKYSTSGVIVKNIFNKLEYGNAIFSNVKLETKGHQQRASDMIMGSLDVTIIWNAVAHLFKDKLDIIPVPKKYIDTITSATYKVTDLRKIKVTIGILSSAKEKQNVRKFYEFAVTEGIEVFNRLGFTPLEKKN